MKIKFKIILIVLLIVVLGIMYFKNKEKNYISVVEENIVENNIVEEDIQSEGMNEELIKVHILGEVNSPGMIELKVGDRVYDAIEKAGGTTELADISKVNLAYILSDGEKIYIPSINDTNDVGMQEEFKSGKVNINTASKEELQSLSGIGESIAQEIVNYRNKNGKFSSIEDIKNVSGIGENKYEKIKDNITVK